MPPKRCHRALGQCRLGLSGLKRAHSCLPLLQSGSARASAEHQGPSGDSSTMSDCLTNFLELMLAKLFLQDLSRLGFQFVFLSSSTHEPLSVPFSWCQLPRHHQLVKHQCLASLSLMLLAQLRGTPSSGLQPSFVGGLAAGAEAVLTKL